MMSLQEKNWTASNTILFLIDLINLLENDDSDEERALVVAIAIVKFGFCGKPGLCCSRSRHRPC
jgi:hypothetical protein